MKKEFELNRKTYKDIKRMDHHQMETYIKEIYDLGVKNGEQAATDEQIKPADIKLAISSVKGIGDKKTEEIMLALEKIQKIASF